MEMEIISTQTEIIRARQRIAEIEGATVDVYTEDDYKPWYEYSVMGV